MILFLISTLSSSVMIPRSCMQIKVSFSRGFAFIITNLKMFLTIGRSWVSMGLENYLFQNLGTRGVAQA